MFSFPVCQASVIVEVAPKVEAVKGETAQLPCKYTVSPTTTNTIVEWYIVSHFQFFICSDLIQILYNPFPIIHLLSYHLERGAGNPDASSFPIPRWTGQKWCWNPHERACLHWRGPQLDHLLGSTFWWAHLLLSGHSWSCWGWRCRHYAQSLLWVNLCPFEFYPPSLTLTFPSTV